MSVTKLLRHGPHGVHVAVMETASRPTSATRWPNSSRRRSHLRESDRHSLNVGVWEPVKRWNGGQQTFSPLRGSGTVEKELRHGEKTWRKSFSQAALTAGRALCEG